jgi:hypothetical protein
MSRQKAHLIFSIFISCSVFLAGCRYQGINTNEYSQKTLFLQVRNHSLAPQLSGFLRRSILEELIKKSALRFSTEKEDADLLAFVTLVNYSNAPEVFDKSDTFSASGFGMEIEANLEVSRDGSKVFSQLVKGSASVLKEDAITLPHARQANMAMAQDLARKISFLLVSQLK